MTQPGATTRGVEGTPGEHGLLGPTALRVRLLGELDLRLDGRPLPPLESARAESLLAHLLLHQEAPQPRQRLAFLLWPDSTEPQARTNLRHVLHNLRRALPDLDRFLDVTPRTLRWRAGAALWLDVAAFEEALAGGEADGGLAALREAVGLYRGDLLQGSDDEWLVGQRERLRQGYLRALERLTALLAARGDHAEAIGYAERLLRHDPLRERTYQVLMRLHDARGDRARALRAYHTCAATLERELGVEPSAATRRAHEALLPPREGPDDDAAGRGRLGPLGGPPLVGRAAEWAHLTALWRDAERGRARLVLVTGEPGVGKTRLVDELRSWCAQRGRPPRRRAATPRRARSRTGRWRRGSVRRGWRGGSSGSTGRSWPSSRACCPSSARQCPTCRRRRRCQTATSGGCCSAR